MQKIKRLSCKMSLAISMLSMRERSVAVHAQPLKRLQPSSWVLKECDIVLTRKYGNLEAISNLCPAYSPITILCSLLWVTKAGLQGLPRRLSTLE